MGDKIELNTVVADLETWSTTELLKLRAELNKRLEQADDLQSFIRSMAKEYALQAYNNLPEIRQFNDELTKAKYEDKLEREALKDQLKNLREENERRNEWLREYVEKVKRGEADLNQLKTVLPWDMLGRMQRPTDTDHVLPPGDDWENVEWAYTQIGITLFFRHNGNPHTIQVWTVTGIFDGQLEQAIKEITPQVLYAIFRIPSISDFSGKPAWLEDNEALLVLKELTYYKYIRPREFRARRSAIFNNLWRTKKVIVYQVRKNAMDSFTTFVNRTFKNREKRINRSTLSSS